jgi:hypothetical protein
MDRVVPTSRAEFLQLQPVLLLLLVLRRRVIAVLTIAALQRDNFAHRSTPLSVCQQLNSQPTDSNDQES